MSSTAARGFTAIVLLIATRTAWAADEGLAAFVAGSGSTANPVILSMMRSADLGDRLVIAQALGERADPYVGDILEAFASGPGGPGRYQDELVLRVLLSSLLSLELSADARRARIEANRQALDRMVNAMDSFQDPQLQSLLVDAADSLGDTMFHPILAARARVLLDAMTRLQGRLSPQEGAFLLRLLRFFGDHPTMDFLPLCTAAARLSREKTLVDAARNAAVLCAAASR